MAECQNALNIAYSASGNRAEVRKVSEAPGMVITTRSSPVAPALPYRLTKLDPLRRSRQFKIERRNRSLYGLVRLHVVPRLDHAAELAGGQLLLVLVFDLGEVERDLIGRKNVAVARPAGLVG